MCLTTFGRRARPGDRLEGWIKLHRKLADWEWYTDVNTCHLFLHLLIHANHEPAKWRGIMIERGQILTGRESLAALTGLSSKSVRTSLDKLKSTSEVAIESNNQYSIITIIKWDEYQLMGQQGASQTANEGPARGQPNGHKQEDKNDKNKKNIDSMSLSLFAEEGQADEKQVSQNRFAEFRLLFPKTRAGSWSVAEKAYFRAIKRASEDDIIAGLQRYVKSDEVARGFAKGAAAWLNDDRWTSNYASTPAPAIPQQNTNFRPANPARNRKVIT